MVSFTLIISIILIILIIIFFCCLQSFQTSLLRLSSNHCRIHLTYLHLPSDSLNMQAGSMQGPLFALWSSRMCWGRLHREMLLVSFGTSIAVTCRTQQEEGFPDSMVLYVDAHDYRSRLMPEAADITQSCCEVFAFLTFNTSSQAQASRLLQMITKVSHKWRYCNKSVGCNYPCDSADANLKN